MILVLNLSVVLKLGTVTKAREIFSSLVPMAKAEISLFKEQPLTKMFYVEISSPKFFLIMKYLLFALLCNWNHSPACSSFILAKKLTSTNLIVRAVDTLFWYKKATVDSSHVLNS
jgi:hypothetical protein